MNNKYIVFIISSCAIIAIGFLLVAWNYTNQKSIPLFVEPNIEKITAHSSFKMESLTNNDYGKSPSTTTASMVVATEMEMSDEEIQSGTWPEYSNDLSGKLNSKDPRVTTSISEYPLDYQNVLKERLEEQKRLGYTPIEQEEFIDREMDIKSHLFSNGDAKQNAAFKLSKIPEILSNGYIGYVMEDAPPNNAISFKSHVIRRVFEVDGVVISLEESSAKNGSSHFIEEFVNQKIGEYPALINTLRMGNKKFEQLVWDTDTYRYAIYGLSNKPIFEVRKHLLDYATQITELNSN